MARRREYRNTTIPFRGEKSKGQGSFFSVHRRGYNKKSEQEIPGGLSLIIDVGELIGEPAVALTDTAIVSLNLSEAKARALANKILKALE